jgi:tetratricopeptide (TPR) repeat protein
MSVPFELARRYSRLPRWSRLCLQALAAALGTGLALAVFALLATGEAEFRPFGQDWRWLSLTCFAALNLVAAVLGNRAYDAYRTWEDARLPSAGEFFRNHALTRLVGQSIGMTLRACEPELPDADARTVHRLAERAERDWPEIAAQEHARERLPEIRDDRLLAFVRDPQRPALSDDQVADLLALLHPDDLDEAPEFADPATGPRVRQAIARRFGEALRQALKRDFAHRGEAAYGMWLDIAGELLAQGAAGLPSTDDNARALESVRVTLSLGLPVAGADAAEIRARMAAQAERLDGVYRAVRAEGRASRRLHGITHGRLALVALLVVAVGLSGWHLHQRTQGTLEAGQQRSDARLAAIEAQLREALTPKQAGEDPTQRQLPPELIAKARELAERGNTEQQAVAAIALKQHAEADRLIQDLKRDPLAETFRLLTLEGGNWYNAGEFDRAIGPFEQALALRPEEPAAMNNAAIAHVQARLGDIAAHQREAISLLTQAQGTWTREAHPAEWAGTQNNLGLAWADMPIGDRAENFGKAIAAYGLALEIQTREANPEEWAMTQNNLGNAWLFMPTGDRAKNLGKAIAAYGLALEVRTREAHPAGWATTQNNLGLARADMPTGDRAENLGKAIAAHGLALEVFTREAHPADWAMTQNNLGNAWAQMPTGDRAENLGKAIAAYALALEVHTREAHPVDWASTQNNLGIAWQFMPTGDRAQNLGKAIAAYTLALEVSTREAHPADWALTQNNLGNAWRDMPTGDRAENLGKAIAAYKLALEVRTREAQPTKWAMTRFNLGVAYWAREGMGGGWPDLRLAIASVRATESVVTGADFPYDYRNRIAPALQALRTAWLQDGHGTQAEFDAIPPAE